MLTLHSALQVLGLWSAQGEGWEQKTVNPAGQGSEWQFGNCRSVLSRWVVRSLRWICLHFSSYIRQLWLGLTMFYCSFIINSSKDKSGDSSLLCNSRVKAESFLCTELQTFAYHAQWRGCQSETSFSVDLLLPDFILCSGLSRVYHSSLAWTWWLLVWKLRLGKLHHTQDITWKMSARMPREEYSNLAITPS